MFGMVSKTTARGSGGRESPAVSRGKAPGRGSGDEVPRS